MAPKKKKIPTNNDNISNTHSSQRELRSKVHENDNNQLKMLSKSKDITKTGTKASSKTSSKAGSKASTKASHNLLDKSKANLLASQMVIKFKKLLV